MTDPKLESVGFLIFENYSGGVSVSSLGATYTEPPRCCDAIDAEVAWVAALNRDELARDGFLNPREFEVAAPHIRAFLDSIYSGFFIQGWMPTTVEVPGLGRWTFESAPKGVSQ